MLFPDDLEHLSALAELIRRWVSYRWHRADNGKRYAPHSGRGRARAVRRLSPMPSSKSTAIDSTEVERINIGG
jgi:hypothetical protein